MTQAPERDDVSAPDKASDQTAGTPQARADAWLERFSRALAARDVASADMSGVSGTPTFFVNGRRHQGVYDVDTLTREVQAAFQAATRAGTTTGSMASA